MTELVDDLGTFCCQLTNPIDCRFIVVKGHSTGARLDSAKLLKDESEEQKPYYFVI